MMIYVLKMSLPIVAAFFCGILCRRKGILDDRSCQAIKDLVCDFMVPLVLINSFMFASYAADTLILIGCIFLSAAAIFGIGFLVGKLFPARGRCLPFLFSTFEVATLGYPLVALLFPQVGPGVVASMDIGHTIFYYLLAFPALKMMDSAGGSIRKSLQALLTTPLFISMVLGIILGLSGVGRVLAASPIYPVYNAVIDFISAPAGMLILVALGYEISLDRRFIKPMLLSLAGRYVLMAVFCGLTLLVISGFRPLEPAFVYSLAFAFSLPISYGNIVFGKFEGQKDFVSSAISFSTVFTILMFIILSVLIQL